MDRTNYRGLAFLLSLGALPIACKPDDKNETDGGTGTTGTGDGTGTTDAPTTGDDSEGDATGSETGSEPTSGPTGEPTGDETGAASVVCEAYATRYVECVPGADRAEILMYCEQTLELFFYYGAACGMAGEDYYVCLTGLSCPDLESAEGCGVEEEQVATICELG